jgi:chorismate synthase
MAETPKKNPEDPQPASPNSPGVPVNEFSMKDAEGVGKEVARTTVVWTLAGVLTQGLRAVIDQITKRKTSN